MVAADPLSGPAGWHWRVMGVNVWVPLALPIGVYTTPVTIGKIGWMGYLCRRWIDDSKRAMCNS